MDVRTDLSPNEQTDLAGASLQCSSVTGKKLRHFAALHSSITSRSAKLAWPPRCFRHFSFAIYVGLELSALCRTLALIKPDAIATMGEVITKVLESGFLIGQA